MLESLGGFDEKFFLYGEDMDLCARVRAAGHQVRYEPQAHAHHEGGGSAPRASLVRGAGCGAACDSRARHSSAVGALIQCVGLAVGAFTHLIVAVPSTRAPSRARRRLQGDCRPVADLINCPPTAQVARGPVALYAGE